MKLITTDEQLRSHLPNVIALVKGETPFIERLALFPDFSLIEVTAPIQGSKWDRCLELRTQVIDLEASLAEEWFSPELMSALRSENLRGDLTQKRSEIVRQIKAQVVGYLRSGSFNSRRLADILNFIRLNAESFEEWHKSVIVLCFAVQRTREGVCAADVPQ